MCMLSVCLLISPLYRTPVASGILKRDVDAGDRRLTAPTQRLQTRHRRTDGDDEVTYHALSGSVFVDLALGISVSVVLCAFSYIGQAMCSMLLGYVAWEHTTYNGGDRYIWLIISTFHPSPIPYSHISLSYLSPTYVLINYWLICCHNFLRGCR